MEAADLSSFSVNSEIDSLFSSGERLVQLNGVSLRARRGNEDDVESIHQFLTTTGIAPPIGKEDCACAPSMNSSIPTVSSLTRDLSSEVIQRNQVFPMYLLLEKQKEDMQWQVCALTQWSFGYSTWKGRVMNLNTFIPGTYEEIAMRCIIETAVVLGCSRIVFQVGIIIVNCHYHCDPIFLAFAKLLPFLNHLCILDDGQRNSRVVLHQASCRTFVGMANFANE